ncbi:hypothetical protein IQ252_13815 [Tychonema sp. LEGE 07203]|nr:hypothetical protein [Tychonema sp. LEGE 07203]
MISSSAGAGSSRYLIIIDRLYKPALPLLLRARAIESYYSRLTQTNLITKDYQSF